MVTGHSAPRNESKVQATTDESATRKALAYNDNHDFASSIASIRDSCPAVPAQLHFVPLQDRHNDDQNVRLSLHRGLAVIESFQLSQTDMDTDRKQLKSSRPDVWDPFSDAHIQHNTTSTTSAMDETFSGIGEEHTADLCTGARIHLRCTTPEAEARVARACNQLWGVSTSNSAGASNSGWKFPGIFCILRRISARESSYSVIVYVYCGLYMDETALLRDAPIRSEILCYAPIARGLTGMLTDAMLRHKVRHLLQTNAVHAVLKLVEPSHLMHILWDVHIGAGDNGFIRDRNADMFDRRGLSYGISGLLKIDLSSSVSSAEAKSKLLIAHRLLQSHTHGIASDDMNVSVDILGSPEVRSIALQVMDLLRPQVESIDALKLEFLDILASQFTVSIIECGDNLRCVVRFPISSLAAIYHRNIESALYSIDSKQWQKEDSSAHATLLPLILQLHRDLATKPIPLRGDASIPSYMDGTASVSDSFEINSSHINSNCDNMYKLYANIAWCIGCIYIGKCLDQ
jgi:hypothetical protein